MYICDFSLWPTHYCSFSLCLYRVRSVMLSVLMRIFLVSHGEFRIQYNICDLSVCVCVVCSFRLFSFLIMHVKTSVVYKCFLENVIINFYVMLHTSLQHHSSIIALLNLKYHLCLFSALKCSKGIKLWMRRSLCLDHYIVKWYY